ALPQPTAQTRDALLVDRRRRAIAVLPAAEQQADPEVEVLGEAVGPRLVAERLERRQADELPVAAEADAPDRLARPLEDLGECPELHVLHPREQVVRRIADVDCQL